MRQPCVSESSNPEILGDYNRIAMSMGYETGRWELRRQLGGGRRRVRIQSIKGKIYLSLG
jgi:hypothetical protein